MNNKVSIVVCTRNDNHGGNLVERTNSFLNGLAYKLEKHNLNVELIIVEWNKIAESPSIENSLDFSNIKNFADIKIISVSKKHHLNIANSEKINFFQMIAKNVGIRRSTGDFILATNIDIIFNDKVIEFLKNGKIKKNTLYRLDRHDIKLNHTNNFNEKFLNENVETINKINFTYSVHSNRRYYVNSSFLRFFYLFKYSVQDNGLKYTIKKVLNKILKFKIKNLNLYINFIFKVMIAKFLTPKIYTNACGDFTLLDKETWFRLNGYSELPYFSWHLDSLFLWLAYYKNVKFMNLDESFYIFHLSHKSGGSIGDLEKMYENLKKKKIPYISNLKFIDYLQLIKKSKLKEIGQNNNFGLNDINFEIIQIRG